MFDLFLIQALFFHTWHVFAVSPVPNKIDAILPKTCFYADVTRGEAPADEHITCLLGAAGMTPSRVATFDHEKNRCCFYGKFDGERGVFWAIGESLLSEITEDIELWRKNIPFYLKKAVLTDILALDRQTLHPVSGVRVRMSNDEVHLVALNRETDEDGYAVLPLIPGQHAVVTLRATGYLPSDSVTIIADEMQTEHEILLDPGLTLSGTVTAPNGARLAHARLHVEVERSAGNWHSDLDLPKAVSTFATTDGKAYQPSRGSFTTNEAGRFTLEHIPRGKLRIYATHANYAPSQPVQLDAAQIETPQDLNAISLSLSEPRRAWIRVQNENQTAIAAQLTIFDERTLSEMGQFKTPTSGALELTILPENARFFITADTFMTHIETRKIAQNDEIILTLERARSETLTMRVLSTENDPIAHATISLSDAALRAQHPNCRAKSDRNGYAYLSACPVQASLEISHPDFARRRVHIDERTRFPEYRLDSGFSLDIQCLDEQTHVAIPHVDCSLINIDTNTSIPTQTITIESGRFPLTHQTPGKYRLACRNERGDTVEKTVELTQEIKNVVVYFPHIRALEARVYDSFGAPAPFARIDADRRTYESDETGYVKLSVKNDGQLTAAHWLHGSTSIAVPKDAERIEIRLPDRPNAQTLQCLKSAGIQSMVDSAAIYVDHPGHFAQLKRGDFIETCTERSLVAVRNGQRITIETSSFF